MRLIGKRNRNAVCTVRICGSIRNQGLAKKQLLSENKMWRGNSFVGQTPLFTPLYIFLPVSFLSPYKYSCLYFSVWNPLQVPRFISCLLHMFLIEGREVIYLKMGEGNPPQGKC